jgi:hypothetical protein
MLQAVIAQMISDATSPMGIVGWSMFGAVVTPIALGLGLNAIADIICTRCPGDWGKFKIQENHFVGENEENQVRGESRWSPVIHRPFLSDK